MKELFRVRVQYASRQQCCKTHKRPLSLPFTLHKGENDDDDDDDNDDDDDDNNNNNNNNNNNVKTCFKRSVNSKTHAYVVPYLSLVYLKGRQFGLSTKHYNNVSVCSQLPRDVSTILRGKTSCI